MKNKFLLTLFLGLTYLSQAQTTMENFSFGAVADTITNPTKGIWKRHSGTGFPIPYATNSLSFPGYASSGVGGSANFTFRTASSEDAHRRVISYSSGNVYISFLLRMSITGGTTADYFFHVLDTSFLTAFRARVWVVDGTAANTYQIGLSKGTNTVNYATPNYNKDSTVLVVLKYAFNASVNDTVYGYVFTNSIPATEPAVPHMVSSDISQGDLAVLNAVAIRQGAVGNMSGTIDGIRVSNSWANGPLPVTLLDFKASLNEANGTQLNWSTSSEINNKGFEIEQSKDGEIFETIDFVKGAGNSKTVQRYQANLNYFAPAYYRLKQVDFDGAFEYSEVVYSGGEVSEIELSPNPFVETIKLNSNSNIDRIEIIDLTGKVLVSETINQLTAEVETAHLAKGIYFINISQGGSVQTKRIIKTN